MFSFSERRRHKPFGYLLEKMTILPSVMKTGMVGVFLFFYLGIQAQMYTNNDILYIPENVHVIGLEHITVTQPRPQLTRYSDSHKITSKSTTFSDTHIQRKHHHLLKDKTAKKICSGTSTNRNSVIGRTMCITTSLPPSKTFSRFFAIKPFSYQRECYCLKVKIACQSDIYGDLYFLRYCFSRPPPTQA